MKTQPRAFDKGGDEFYDQISALHKSIRGSDPDAALYSDFQDFGFFRMSVERAHYLGGFAQAVWSEARHILIPKKIAAEMADIEASVIEHMNADHGNAVKLYAESL